MLDFQIFNPTTFYIPHQVITSKNISLTHLQRGNYSFITVGGDDFNTGSIYEPPPLELYTKFSLQAYFLMFWGILIVQTFVILIIDKTLVKTIPQSATKWERFIHAIVKSHFPFPYVNWYEGFGDCKDHIKRQKAAQHEVLITMATNLFFNMTMLIPLVILCEYCPNVSTTSITAMGCRQCLPLS